MPEPSADLSPGDVVWVQPDRTIGREQAGRRPVLVIASTDYLATVDTLAIVVPITTVDRGWPNHIPIRGTDLPQACWAMSEQVRTVSRDRILSHAGSVDDQTLGTVRRWVRDFLEL